MRLQDDALFVFSGRMFAGKDHVAKTAGLTIKGFADPIYQICEYFNGTSDKSVPGVRKFLQQIGQWGWGCISVEYPCNMERAAIVDRIHSDGRLMTRDFKWVAWEEFGRRKDFWVNIALTSLGLTAQNFSFRGQSFLFPEFTRPADPYRLAITNTRFTHELEPCRRVGFNHFHVRCSEETRLHRMFLRHYAVNPADDNDTSEAMAKQLDMDMPEGRVIWNDTRPMPAGKRYLTLEDFVELVTSRTESDTASVKSCMTERLAAPFEVSAPTAVRA